MIRVMLFLDPQGTRPITEWKVLGRIDIENDVARTIMTGGTRGNYIARIYKKRPSLWKRVVLEDFPRLSYHPWEMIRQILNIAAEKNGGRL